MYIQGGEAGQRGINREDANILSRYKRLDLRNMIDFVLSDFVCPPVRNVASMLTGNPVQILMHRRISHDDKFQERIDMLSKCFTSITERVLQNIMGFGFVSFHVDGETGGIDIVDYRNGELFFRVDSETNAYSFAWVRYLFKGSSQILDDSYVIRERKIDVDCHHYVPNPPTDMGVLSGELVPLLGKFMMVRDLADYCFEIERRKVINPMYYKKQLPPLKFEEYTMLMEHTMNTAAGRARQISPDIADAMNMQTNGPGVGAVFGEEHRADLRLMAKRMSELANNDTVTYDKRTNRLTAGPLVDLMFMPIHEPSKRVEQLAQDLRDSVNERVACYQFVSSTRAGNVKEFAGLTGAFLRPMIMKLKYMLDSMFTIAAGVSLGTSVKEYVDAYLEERAKRRARRREAKLAERDEERANRTQRRREELTEEERERRDKEDELEQQTYEAKEINAHNLLKAEMLMIQVEMDPVPYLSDGDKEMLMNTTLGFDQIAKPVFGGGSDSLFGDLTGVMTLENAKLEIERQKLALKERELGDKVKMEKAKIKAGERSDQVAAETAEAIAESAPAPIVVEEKPKKKKPKKKEKPKKKKPAKEEKDDEEKEKPKKKKPKKKEKDDGDDDEDDEDADKPKKKKPKKKDKDKN